MRQGYYDDLIYSVFGECLREARLEKNMSLRQLSEAMNGKKTKSTLQRYEEGTFRFTKEGIKEVCSAMNVDYDEFVDNATQRYLDAVQKEMKWLKREHDFKKTYHDSHVEQVVSAYLHAPPHIQKAIDSLLQIDK